MSFISDISYNLSNPISSVSDGSNVWITTDASGIYKINISSNSISLLTDPPSNNYNNPFGISYDGINNCIWFSSKGTGNCTIHKINISSNVITQYLTINDPSSNAMGISSDGTNVWITCTNNNLYQFDISLEKYTKITDNDSMFKFGGNYSISSDGINVWICNINADYISKYNISTKVLTHITNLNYIGSGISCISSDGAYVWISTNRQWDSSDNISYYNDISQNSIVSSDGTNVWIINNDNTIKQYNIAYGTTTILEGIFTNPTNIISDGINVWVIDGGTLKKIIIVSPSPILPPIACFLHNSKILTEKGYRPIQDLRSGDMIKTSINDYKKIYMIGKRDIIHPNIKERVKSQLYKFTKDFYPEIIDDELIVTGCHCILVDNFKNEEEKNKTMEMFKNLPITDNKFRLPACIDERSMVYEKGGKYTVYHIALEHDDCIKNYGIYANGLLVESCSKLYLTRYSNMIMIE